jgi:hypothetical protein
VVKKCFAFNRSKMVLKHITRNAFKGIKAFFNVIGYNVTVIPVIVKSQF